MSLAVGAQQFDLGLGITPLSVLKGDEDTSMETLYGTGSEDDFFRDNVIALHAGATFMGFLYASVEANIMPPWWIKSVTEYTDRDGVFQQGIYAPGFISFVDVGIRPVIGSIILMAEAGINMLYVHSAYTEGLDDGGGKAGVNMRLGLGLDVGIIDLMLTGTLVFPDFDAMVGVLKGVAEGNKMATDAMLKSLIPSLLVSLRF
jgi:hypothetical protein